MYPVRPPYELMQYQRDAVQRMAPRARYGLHDEMGVGKTATVIGALDALGAKRFYIVVPAHLRTNWIREFGKFSAYQRRIVKAQSVNDVKAWQMYRFDGMVISYEQATKYEEMLRMAGPVEVIAFDEAHYLKNLNATRTKKLLGEQADSGIVEWADHAWHVTGTPMANDPMDIYTFLRMCHATPLTAPEFVRRYFHARLGAFSTRCDPKPEMVPELKYLIDNNSIRRTKDEVGLQLPPIFLTSAFVDGELEAVKQMLREHPGLDKAIRNALEGGSLSFLDNQHVATLRRLLGEAKSIPYAHMLVDELRTDPSKRVVFGVHKAALANIVHALRQHQIGCRLFTGDSSAKEKDEAEHAFMTDPNCRVIVGNIRAMGTGLTLTSAFRIDMFESDWSPAGNAQAIMRVHRIGQTQTVHGRFISLASSFDEVVTEIVAEKTAAIARIEGNFMQAAPVDALEKYV